MSEQPSEPELTRSIETASVYLFRELALGVFHHLTNDLQSIGSTLHLLESYAESLPGSFQRDFELLLLQTLRHVENARETLHAVSRRGANLKPVLRTYMLARDILRPALERQTRSRDYGIRWETSLTSSDFAVNVDRELLLEAVLALYDNAVRAVRENRTTRKVIFVSARPVGDSGVRVEISDTGVGITPGVISKVFDPFFTTRQRGTGLGLYFARIVVEHFGGKLTLERSVVRKGSTFAFHLPRVE